MVMRLVLAGLLAVAVVGRAQAQLPVREVTVFKDGHAFVLAEGERPVKDGAVVLDQLPVPVLGTFWPYATQTGVTLVSARAGAQSVSQQRPVASVREVLEANLGKSATIQEVTGIAYLAKIIAVQGEGLVLLELEKGLKALPLSRIQDVTIEGTVTRTVATTTNQNRLTLQLAGARETSARVGVLYLQRGLRWIPSYKVVIDGKGQAQLKLQATLVNDLIDLDKASVNLVVGIPAFAFQDTPDPISLQEGLAQVAASAGGRGAMLGNRLMNSQMVMGQYGGGGMAPGGSEPPSTPEVTGAEKNEDLFVFTAKNVTLKKGERLVLPLAEMTLPYTNVYTLELLPRPAQQNAYGGYDYSQLRPELAKLVAQPKAMHKIRLTNTSRFPLTTAPALILRGERIVAQGTMTYAAPGGKCDLALTEAPDITIKRRDTESTREPNATLRDGYNYFKVSMTGAVELCNYRAEPVEVEVTRYVLGKVTEADSKGEITTLDPLGDDTLPDWLNQYGNIGDRIRFTGLGRVTWTTTLPPGGKTCITLGYHWHYYTR